MLRGLRSWEIILVPFSERRNPFSAGRGVRALAPLNLLGPDLACSLFSPHAGSQSGSLRPASVGESKHIPQINEDTLRSLVFYTSAQPRLALFAWGRKVLGCPG